MIELETVGAIAVLRVFRIPTPEHHSGSPNLSARSCDAFKDSSFIVFQINQSGFRNI
jgi:hypothetical protein